MYSLTVPNEHLIVNGLREARALSLSLVAEANGKIIGHIAFSVVIKNRNDVGQLGLGPFSVFPALQKQGVGSALIIEGLSMIRVMRARGCVLDGNPKYYQRFGFKSYPKLFCSSAPDPEYFMALPFYENVPKGKVEFHNSFFYTSVDWTRTYSSVCSQQLIFKNVFSGNKMSNK